jgi:hypothetical protein
MAIVLEHGGGESAVFHPLALMSTSHLAARTSLALREDRVQRRSQQSRVRLLEEGRMPLPYNLAVWRGHAGIVVNPVQHSFFSVLRSGPGRSRPVEIKWTHYPPGIPLAMAGAQA